MSQMKHKWEITFVKEGTEDWLLESGWEPFSVVFHPGWGDSRHWNNAYTDIWLKRQVVLKDEE